MESDVVVPAETASEHAEYMARTLRPKLLKRRDEFLQPVETVKPRINEWPRIAEGWERDIPKSTSAVK